VDRRLIRETLQALRDLFKQVAQALIIGAIISAPFIIETLKELSK
jgi:hypothetical protein